MNKPKVGQIVTDRPVGAKDAFHVAGVVTRSWDSLKPGAGVKFDGSLELVVAADKAKRDAIVDPFLSEPTKPGESFWVFPMPDLVGNLSHTFEVDGYPSPRTMVLPDGVDEGDLQCAIEGC